MKDIDELREKQENEIKEFIENCTHPNVKVEDYPDYRGGRIITIRCTICRLNLAGFSTDSRGTALDYVRDCINKAKK